MEYALQRARPGTVPEQVADPSAALYAARTSKRRHLFRSCIRHETPALQCRQQHAKKGPALTRWEDAGPSRMQADRNRLASIARGCVRGKAAGEAGGPVLAPRSSGRRRLPAPSPHGTVQWGRKQSGDINGE
jgi:hypothetical protein